MSLRCSSRDTTGRRRTSVKLTGAPLPTILPIVEAFCLMVASYSRVSFRLASTCASRAFFWATSSSAFSFAYVHRPKTKISFLDSQSSKVTRYLFLCCYLLLNGIDLLAHCICIKVHCRSHDFVEHEQPLHSDRLDIEHNVLFTHCAYISMTSSTSSTECPRFR